MSSQNAGFVAYNCQNPSTNLSVISLVDIEPCPDPDTNYKETTEKVLILERDLYNQIHVKTCLMEVTKIITHCGMHSHSSIVNNGLSSSIQRIGKEACENIHRYGEYRGFHNQVIGELKPNSTTPISITLAGRTDNNGKCQGTIYTSNGQNWEDVVVTASVKITITDYWTTVKLDANEVVLNDGLVCPYLEGSCFDNNLGEIYWTPVAFEDCDKYTTLYTGSATIVEEKVSSHRKNHYVVVEQETMVIALKLLREQSLCNNIIWVTEHARLIVIRNYDGEGSNKWSKPHTSKNVDITNYFNSKLLYLEVSLKKNIETTYSHTVNRRCELHREILKNRLTLARNNPNEVIELIKGPGLFARLGAEVLYVFQCQPVVVRLQKLDKCYVQLPVIFENRTMFMSPVSRILQSVGEQIECSELTPPLYKFDTQWFGLAPRVVRGIKPQILSIESEPGIKFQGIQAISSAGLYSESELKRSLDSITFHAERHVINNIVARKIGGREVDTQGYSTFNLFDQTDVEHIASTMFSKVYNFINTFGHFSAGFLMIYLIVRLLFSLVGTFLNALALHHAYGWAVHLLAAGWNSLTNYLLHRRARQNHRENLQQLAVPVDVETALPMNPGMNQTGAELQDNSVRGLRDNQEVRLTMYPIINNQQGRATQERAIQTMELAGPSAPRLDRGPEDENGVDPVARPTTFKEMNEILARYK